MAVVVLQRAWRRTFWKARRPSGEDEWAKLVGRMFSLAGEKRGPVSGFLYARMHLLEEDERGVTAKALLDITRELCAGQAKLFVAAARAYEEAYRRWWDQHGREVWEYAHWRYGEEDGEYLAMEGVAFCRNVAWEARCKAKDVAEEKCANRVLCHGALLGCMKRRPLVDVDAVCRKLEGGDGKLLGRVLKTLQPTFGMVDAFLQNEGGARACFGLDGIDERLVYERLGGLYRAKMGRQMELMSQRVTSTAEMRLRAMRSLEDYAKEKLPMELTRTKGWLTQGWEWLWSVGGARWDDANLHTKVHLAAMGLLVTRSEMEVAETLVEWDFFYVEQLRVEFKVLAECRMALVAAGGNVELESAVERAFGNGLDRCRLFLECGGHLEFCKRVFMWEGLDACEEELRGLVWKNVGSDSFWMRRVVVWCDHVKRLAALNHAIYKAVYDVLIPDVMMDAIGRRY